MLAELGAAYVLVGHSERRAFFAESSETVAEKFLAAQAHGLTPVLCLGETLQQRERGETEQTVLEQLDIVLQRPGSKRLQTACWPTSRSGRSDGQDRLPEQAQQVHQILREHIAVKDPAVADALRMRQC